MSILFVLDYVTLTVIFNLNSMFNNFSFGYDPEGTYLAMHLIMFMAN